LRKLRQKQKDEDERKQMSLVNRTKLKEESKNIDESAYKFVNTAKEMESLDQLRKSVAQ